MHWHIAVILLCGTAEQQAILSSMEAQQQAVTVCAGSHRDSHGEPAMLENAVVQQSLVATAPYIYAQTR